MEKTKESIIIHENIKTDPKIEKQIVEDLEYMLKNYSKFGLLMATPIIDEPHGASSAVSMLKPVSKPILSFEEVD